MKRRIVCLLVRIVVVAVATAIVFGVRIRQGVQQQEQFWFTRFVVDAVNDESSRLTTRRCKSILFQNNNNDADKRTNNEGLSVQQKIVLQRRERMECLVRQTLLESHRYVPQLDVDGEDMNEHAQVLPRGEQYLLKRIQQNHDKQRRQLLLRKRKRRRLLSYDGGDDDAPSHVDDNNNDGDGQDAERLMMMYRRRSLQAEQKQTQLDTAMDNNLAIHNSTNNTNSSTANHSNMTSKEESQQQIMLYDQEHEALITFYKHFKGEQWNNRFGWDTIDYNNNTTARTENDNNNNNKEPLPLEDDEDLTMMANHCIWYGIECSDNEMSVTSIVLLKNNLRGKFDWNLLTNFSNLEILALSENDITGTIPSPSLQQRSTTTLPSLKELYLRENLLEGTIPNTSFQEIAPNLKALVLSDNLLEGSITNQFNLLTNLTTLDLGNNQLYGKLPWHLFLPLEQQEEEEVDDYYYEKVSLLLLPQLKELLLDGNAFTGSLPSLSTTVTGKASDLRQLNVAQNQLTGTLEESFFESLSPTLEKLSLRNNAFVGTLSTDMQHMINLKALDLSLNKLSGTLSTELFHEMTQLQLLNLNDNLFSGQLPFSTTTTTTITLQEEDEAAETTVQLTNTTSTTQQQPFSFLQYLYLSGNEFTGTLSNTMMFDSLDILDVSNNRLSGTIPSNLLSSSSNIRELWLHDNLLEGTLPIGRMDDGDLNLVNDDEYYNNESSTNITNDGDDTYTSTSTGRGSASSPSSSSLEVFHVASNRLTGTLSSDIGHYSNLQILNLSQNNFNATLPTEIGQLSKLKTLILSRNKLTGTLPISISNFTKLETFNIDGNRFRGTLSDKGIDQWSSLREFSVAGNFFSGRFPLEELATLSRLEMIDARVNAFSGSLPFEVFTDSSESRLTNIQLSQNQFNGTLSGGGLDKLAKSSLKILELQDNHFSGTLSSEVHWTNLQLINLRGNHFRGTLPSSLFYQDDTNNEKNSTAPTQNHLTFLDIRDNRFTGILPNIIEEPNKNTTGLVPSSLKRLYMSNNSFVGSITYQNIANPYFEHLLELHLQHNQLVGSLPSELLSHLHKLEELYLHNNNLGGTLPSPLFGMNMDQGEGESSSSSQQPMSSNLRVLSLGHNRFRGTLPSMTTVEGLEENGSSTAITKTSRLEELSLEFNLFRGTIPLIWGHQLTQLRKLDVSHNKLIGQLASSSSSSETTSTSFLKSMTSLQYLDLSVNSFNGNLPTSTTFSSQMEHLDLSRNKFRGPMSNRLGEQLTNLRYFDVSRNHLTGTLPSTLGRLSNLRVLRMANQTASSSVSTTSSTTSSTTFRDGFTGNIPMELGDLVSLQVLDLSGNFLQGTIPPELGRLNGRLRHLDLSSNDLTGYIPSDLGLGYGGAAAGGVGGNPVAAVVGGAGGFALNYLALGENEGLLQPAPLGLCEIADASDRRRRRARGGVGSSFYFDLTSNNDDWCPMERNILKQFFDEANGLRWYNQSGWIEQYTSPCDLNINTNDDNAPYPLSSSSSSSSSWYGIQCNSRGRVTHIDLFDNALAGYIASDIGYLKDLKVFNISRNRVGGTIPSELGVLEELSSLTHLQLSDNRLTGSIPSTLVKLQQLQLIDVSRNTLQDEINFFPGNATSLTYLDVSINHLHGDVSQILDGLLQLQNVTHANLARNEFTGIVPPRAATSNLDLLYLVGNRVTQPIASRLCNSHSSFDLDLKRSSSACPGRQAFLEDLYNATNGPKWTNNDKWLTSSSEDGSVCDWYGITCDNVTNQIIRLDLRDNGLQGTLPSGIKYLEGLRYLDLSKNKLISTIPHDVWTLKELKLLNLNSNRLGGELPPFIGRNSDKLTTILLKNNQFTGSIPIELGELVELRQIELANNSFTGFIPDGFDRQNLTGGIKLKNNSLSGTPPGNLCQNPTFDLRNEIAWCPANLYDDYKILLVVILFLSPLYFAMFVHFLLQSYKSREMNITLDWFKWWLGLKEISPTDDPNVHAVVEQEKEEGADNVSTSSELTDIIHPATPKTGGLITTPGVSSKNLDIFAGIMLSVQLICSIVGGFISLTHGVVEVSIVFGGLLGWTFGLLSWSSALAPSCSKWFLRISLVILPPSTFMGLFAQFFYKSFLLYTLLLYMAWSIPTLLVARTFQNLVAADLVESELLMLSIEMVKRFTAALPAMFFFAMRAFQAFEKANEREEGVQTFHENHVEGWVSVFSGLTILLTFVSSEVFNLAKLSISDIVSFRLRLWEITALASNIALIALALYMETLVEYVDETIAITVICAMFIGPAFQILSLWCVSRDVFHNNHPFMQERILNITETFTTGGSASDLGATAASTQKADLTEMGVAGALHPGSGLSSGTADITSRFEIIARRRAAAAAAAAAFNNTNKTNNTPSQRGTTLRTIPSNDDSEYMDEEDDGTGSTTGAVGKPSSGLSFRMAGGSQRKFDLRSFDVNEDDSLTNNTRRIIVPPQAPITATMDPRAVIPSPVPVSLTTAGLPSVPTSTVAPLMVPPPGALTSLEYSRLHDELEDFMKQEQLKIQNQLHEWMTYHQDIIMNEAQEKLNELDLLLEEQRQKHDQLDELLTSLQNMGI